MNQRIDTMPAGLWLTCLSRFLLVAVSTLTLASTVRATDHGETADTTPYAAFDDWTAVQIMRETQRRHEQFPFVYEEQTMVLMDVQGNRSVRLCRRFTRTEEDGSAKFLLVFDDPEEIRGVALLAVRDASGETTRGVYLPAFGAELKEPAPGTRSEHFLGTDFSVEDLTTESLDEHRYVRGRDRIYEGTEFFIIDAYPANAEIERSSGYGLRRHHIRKDNFMIVQTDFFDRHLRFMKQLSHHDLHPVSGDSWRANMLVVSGAREQHRTLLKVNRRVYSRDYVPEEIFEPAFLLANRHVLALDDHVNGRFGRPMSFGAPAQDADPASKPPALGEEILPSEPVRDARRATLNDHAVPGNNDNEARQ
jgi:hypothetical protein